MPVPNSSDVLAPTGSAGSRAKHEQFLPRANAQQLSVYFGQIQALLNAGVGLMAVLDELSRCGPSPTLRHVSAEMKQQLQRGGRWSAALRDHPTLFRPMVVSLVAAGEESGGLVAICGELSQFAEQEADILRLYNRETWYPKVLLFFSTVIFPLPISVVFWGTPVTFGFREQVLIFGGAWALWYGANWFWPVTSRGRPRMVMDRWKLQLPIVREVARGFAIAKVWRVLALLYAAGVSLPAALRIAAESCGNAAFAESLRAVAPRLERGEPLSSALASTGELPESALGLLRAGEQSGDLDKALAHSVRFIESDAKMTLLKAVKTIALLLYLLVAFKIGVQVVQFWMHYAG